MIPTYATAFAIAILVAALIILSLSRISLPRKSGFEALEDPEAAQAYDRISRWPQFRMLRRMVAGKLARYQTEGSLPAPACPGGQGRQVADIGCGPGYLAALIAQRYPHLHVVGFDSSCEMIRTARLNAAALDLSDRVEFREGDVSSLPVPEGTLDFAVSTLSLHHWSDPGRALAEFQRVLKPGGQLLIFDLRRDPRRFFHWLMRFAQSWVVPGALRRIHEPLGSLLSSYTVAEVENLFAQSPFHEWKVEGGPAWFFAWARKRLPAPSAGG